MGSEQNRFLQQQQQQQQQPTPSRRKRWGGCLSGLSCFGSQKGGKRVAPASRILDSHALANQPNGAQSVGLNNQNTTTQPSLLAPPSSPASNSALPSTVQSPSCFLSANSPGGPSSTMFATGPYANETQLVSPPVFSTFTTEPSTAPLTPPPELAHLTTPSSPDVPYAQFLSSTLNLKGGVEKTNYIAANDLQATYSLYPGSPASTLRSPISRTSGEGLSSFPEQDFSPQWNPSVPSHETKHLQSDSGRLFGVETDGGSKLSQDANFFCPETFAQFYLDQSSFPHSGGRLSVSKESDSNSNAGNGVQSRQSKACKQDVEEIEAYRASFGFSADEIVSTAHYVEISDVMEDSFSMMPFGSHKPLEVKTVSNVAPNDLNIGGGEKQAKCQIQDETRYKMVSPKNCRVKANHHSKGANSELPSSCNGFKDDQLLRQPVDACDQDIPMEHSLTDDEDIFLKLGTSRIKGKHHMGLSSSDAEIDYRRGRSLREGRRDCNKWS